MKLIVQIPCYNEEATLAQTVADIPKIIDNIDVVEILVIDDGSTDGTVEVAHQAGVDHIVSNTTNKGLARSFAKGIDACLERGADIIVNTDGDNQYAGRSIPDLVQPILQGRADIVIGDRNTDSISHFSPSKKLMQRMGSAMVRNLTGLAVGDAVSGFRAYSREAALGINVFSDFSYTVETLIQARSQRKTVVSVPVDTNPKTRDSRLSKSLLGFLKKQSVTIVRSFTMYRSLRVFSIVSLLLFLIGVIPVVRFLVYFVMGDTDGRIQSLVLGGVFITLGYVTFVLALLADAIATNRRLLEATVENVRKLNRKLDDPGNRSALGDQEDRPMAPDDAEEVMPGPVPVERDERDAASARKPHA
ncbi:MAG: glycosyltransferase family 2 protein [Alphaproteobacteria bacterium]|nr:glycosyltransferase family 2 protein [Alphaproteobacteria bacterium]